MCGALRKVTRCQDLQSKKVQTFFETVLKHINIHFENPHRHITKIWKHYKYRAITQIFSFLTSQCFSQSPSQCHIRIMFVLKKKDRDEISRKRKLRT